MVILNLTEYKIKIAALGYEEYPLSINGTEILLQEFIDYKAIDSELKFYLTKHIICRCLADEGYVFDPKTALWFIKSFLNEYNTHHPQPWLTNAIKEAISMILSEEVFTKNIIATTFMFGIIEFYAKFNLGFWSDVFLFSDEINQIKFREMTISSAFQRLRKTKKEIAISLNNIDKTIKHNKSLFSSNEEDFFVSIADRLSNVRNIMLHGENYSYYSEGIYLSLLYILFHLHLEKEINSFKK